MIVEGFFEPLLASCTTSRSQELVRAKLAAKLLLRERTSRSMRPVAERSLDVRVDFPIFARRAGEQPLIYLDSSSTAQKPQSVVDAMSSQLLEHNANVHRGVYELAQEADAAFEDARARIAAFTGARESSTIFTKNVTEAINLVAYSWGRSNLRAGDAVLLTQMEHHANIVPWQVLCHERDASLRYLEVDERGELSLAALEAELERGDVRLVAFAHVSNVLGTINPVAEMVALARAAGSLSLIDGAQAVPQLPVDVDALGADFYAWTGHKALGPTGIGVLHGRREPRADGAVPDRRRDDLLGRAAELELERAAVEVRSGHAARSQRRSASAQPSTTSRGSGWTACASMSSRWLRTC